MEEQESSQPWTETPMQRAAEYKRAWGRREAIKAAMQRAAECTACSWNSKSKGCKQCLGQWEPHYRLTEAAYQFWVGQEIQK